MTRILCLPGIDEGLGKKLSFRPLCPFAPSVLSPPLSFRPLCPFAPSVLSTPLSFRPLCPFDRREKSCSSINSKISPGACPERSRRGRNDNAFWFRLVRLGALPKIQRSDETTRHSTRRDKTCAKRPVISKTGRGQKIAARHRFDMRAAIFCGQRRIAAQRSCCAG